MRLFFKILVKIDKNYPYSVSQQSVNSRKRHMKVKIGYALSKCTSHAFYHLLWLFTDCQEEGIRIVFVSFVHFYKNYKAISLFCFIRILSLYLQMACKKLKCVISCLWRHDLR